MHWTQGAAVSGKELPAIRLFVCLCTKERKFCVVQRQETRTNEHLWAKAYKRESAVSVCLIPALARVEKQKGRHSCLCPLQRKSTTALQGTQVWWQVSEVKGKVVMPEPKACVSYGGGNPELAHKQKAQKMGSPVKSHQLVYLVWWTYATFLKNS